MNDQNCTCTEDQVCDNCLQNDGSCNSDPLPTSAVGFNRLLRAAREAGWGPQPEYKALRVAISSAPWGQNGAVFIDDYSASWGSADRVRSLAINGRVRATLSEGGRLEFYELKDSEIWYQRKKEESRKAHKRHARARTACLRDLQRHGVVVARDFPGWEYWPGMMGGRFYSPDWGQVSAPGVLREVEHVSIEEWEAERTYHGARY